MQQFKIFITVASHLILLYFVCVKLTASFLCFVILIFSVVSFMIKVDLHLKTNDGDIRRLKSGAWAI